jgi:hypothetical protein
MSQYLKSSYFFSTLSPESIKCSATALKVKRIAGLFELEDDSVDDDSNERKRGMREMERWMETKVPRENLPQRHFVCLKSNINSFGIEQELWYSPQYGTIAELELLMLLFCFQSLSTYASPTCYQ